MADLSGVTTTILPTVDETFADNLSNSAGSGDVTVSLNNSAPYSDGDIVALTVDPDTAKQATFIGEVSGNSIINVKWTEGNLGASHDIGAVVVDYVSATHWGMISKHLGKSLNPDGTLKAGAVDNAAVLADDVVETAKIKDKAATLAKVNGGSTAGVLTTDTSGNVAAKSSLVAYATTGVVQGGISGSDLTGLSITFTADGTTKYRIRGSVNVYQNSTNNYAELVIKEGATLIGISNTPLTVGTQRATVTAESIITPSAGSHTYKLFLAFYVGVGETIPSGGTPYIYAEALR